MVKYKLLPMEEKSTVHIPVPEVDENSILAVDLEVI